MRLGAIAALGLILMLCASSRAAEPAPEAPPDAPKSSGNWFTRLFSSGTKTPAPADDPKAKKDETINRQKAARTAAAAQRNREEAALFRRQAVCLKLRAIADQNNDDALRRQVDLLEERAWTVYVRRTAQLSEGTGQALDEALLERHLGPGSQPVSRVAGSSSDGSNSRTASRGDQP